MQEGSDQALNQYGGTHFFPHFALAFFLYRSFAHSSNIYPASQAMRLNFVQNSQFKFRTEMKKHTFPKHATSSELTLGRTRNPSPEFWICCSILKRFYLQWKVFNLLNKVRYILGVVALLEACDVTNNGRHLAHHLGFYQELEIRLRPREMLFFVLYRKK